MYMFNRYVLYMYILLFIVNYFNTRDKCPLFDAGILENYEQKSRTSNLN